MISGISFLNNFRCCQFSFGTRKNLPKNGLKKDTFEKQNISNMCKKELLTPKAIEDVLSKYNSVRYLGSIPQAWLSDVDEDKKESARERLKEEFSNFARRTSCNCDSYNTKYSDDLAIYAFCESFEEITGKIPKIEYLDEGTIGRTFKLSIDNEDYVVKTFFKDPDTYGYYSTHGKGAEVLAAAYTQKHSKKGQYADFHFGKFARENDNDGFLVTKYVDFNNSQKSPITNNLLKLVQRTPVESYDKYNIKNTIFDTIVDYGGLKKGGYLNKKQYRFQREILEAIDNGDYEKYKNILEENKDDKDFNFVSDTIHMQLNLMLLYCFLKSETIGIKPFEHDDERYKLAHEPKYLKFYSMLEFAIRESDKKAYSAIVEKYKDVKEFQEVLKFYNDDMPDDEKVYFSQKMSATQHAYLMETLEKFQIL